MSTETLRWPGIIRFFHWTTVLLLVATWAMIALHENTPDDDFFYIGMHKALGVSVAIWVLMRLVIRLGQQSKAPTPVTGPRWQTLSASLTHAILYGLMLAMPLAGVLMSQYGGRAVSVFGMFELPLMVVPDKTTGKFFHELHTDIFWPLLLLFTAMHIGAAVYHQFILKDNLLKRMR